MSLIKILSAQTIEIKYAINKCDGMEIHPANIDDHRKLTRFLDSGKEEYNKYRLPEDETMRVVLRAFHYR